MANADESSGLNLSGAWHGRYAYPRVKAPVFFAATLAESLGWISGAITEAVPTKTGGKRTLESVVEGRRAGHSVTFLKLYSGDFGSFDSVRYVGTLSDDGLEIEGRWTVPGNWSGTFLMIRASGIAVPLAQAVTEKV